MFKQIVIETTSRCNLQCKGCYRSQGAQADSDMTMKVYKTILDQIDWPCTIVLFSDGEPLLHEDYPEFLELAAKTGNKVQFCTNGTLFRQDVAEVVNAHNNISNVCISVDGFYNSTTKILRGTRLSEIRLNIDKWLAQDVDVAVSMLRNGQTWGEAEMFILYWIGIVDHVILRNFLSSEPGENFHKDYCNYLYGYYVTIKSDGSIRLCERNQKAPVIGTYRNLAGAKKIMDSEAEAFPQGICVNCEQVYDGAGMFGKICFKDGTLQINFRQDYFNQIYSLRDVREGVSWENL